MRTTIRSSVRGLLATVMLLAGASQAADLYFVHTDHLGTPRLIANGAGQAVWQWANDDPFGNNAPNDNPSGLGAFTCELRFPGQYFDRETNLHYNYFRDYDPQIGRYTESDPIGLAGGSQLMHTLIMIRLAAMIQTDCSDAEVIRTLPMRTSRSLTSLRIV